jgi:putative Mg2+ transporter-C (MgtC) family protein
MSGILNWLTSLAEAYPGLRLDLLGKLLLAVLLGGAIGWERERAHKPAGLRTNILICLAATLLSDMSVRVAASSPSTADPGRIAAQIVTGVGFLGAGTILQSRGSVTGLTTAATLWIVSAIGIAVGFGAWVEAAGTTLLVLIALIPLYRFEMRVEAAKGGQSEIDEAH